MNKMNSARFIESIPDYLEGELSEQDHCAFETYLKCHAKEAQYFKDYMAVIQLCQSAYGCDDDQPCCEALIRCTIEKCQKSAGHLNCDGSS